VPQGRPMPFRDQPLDPISRQTFARSIEALHEEFRGIYSLETIERYVNESIDRLSGARVVDFIPLFVHRFARERLRALAQAEGAIIKDVPEVLFVCVHNAGRSQMAAALLDHHAKGKVHVRSAGSAPGDKINPAVVAAMDEWGIDLSKEFPKPLTDDFVRAADVMITMGCGDACPIYPGKRYEDWELQDPAGQPVEVVRRIRDDIDTRVQRRHSFGKCEPGRILRERRPRDHPPRVQSPWLGVGARLELDAVLGVLVVREIGEPLGQFRRRLRHTNLSLHHHDLPRVRQVHGDVRIRPDQLHVDGFRAASVVPDVVDPQAVDRHHVRAPVPAVGGKPVLLGLLKLGTHTLPGQRLGRLPVALRQHQLLGDRHRSAPGRRCVGSTTSAADSPALTALSWAAGTIMDNSVDQPLDQPSPLQGS
jgi:arsenate reductase